MRTSSSWPKIRHISGGFASSGSDKWAGVYWSEAPWSSPVIDEALAWLDRRLHAEHDASDHLIVLCRVQAMIGEIA
ncbi:MAG: flavin reductase family protein [Bosea sp.]|nr:flavin reductase family protein [Bosea sp. (in: a-proteobacteria)]